MSICVYFLLLAWYAIEMGLLWERVMLLPHSIEISLRLGLRPILAARISRLNADLFKSSTFEGSEVFDLAGRIEVVLMDLRSVKE